MVEKDEKTTELTVDLLPCWSFIEKVRIMDLHKQCKGVKWLLNDAVYPRAKFNNAVYQKTMLLDVCLFSIWLTGITGSEYV